MISKTPLLAAVISGVCIFGAAEAAENYKCQITDSSRSGWLPSEIWFHMDPQGENSWAYDPVTWSSGGATNPVAVPISNSVRTTIDWRVRNFDNPRGASAGLGRDAVTGNSMTVQFTATLLKGQNRLLVRAIPSSGTGTFSARGTCRAVDGPLTLPRR